MNNILYTFGISLFDSLSTTLQIVLFVLLLTTEKPLRNSLSYLAGLSGAYFFCGGVGYLALDELLQWLAPVLHVKDLPSSVYYQCEFMTGLVMVFLGSWYF